MNTTRRLLLLTEAEVQSQSIRLFRQYGITLERRNTRTLRVPGKGGRSRLMHCSKSGTPDADGTIPGYGRRLEVEFKRQGWSPARTYGKDLERWHKQLAKLQETNRLGGVGLWIDNPATVHTIAPRLLAGWTVELDDDGSQWFLKDEEYPHS